MKSPQKTPAGSAITTLINLFFKGIYIVIQFFIYIGELTQRFVCFVFMIPVRISKVIFQLGASGAERVRSYIDSSVEYVSKFSLPGRHWTKLPRKYRKKRMIVFPKITVSFPKIPLSQFSFRIKKPKFRMPLKIRVPQISLPKVSLPQVRMPSKRMSIIKTKYFVLGSLITLLIVGSYEGYVFAKSLPTPNEIGKVNYSLSTHMYDRNGRLLYEIYRDENRTPIYLKDLPAYAYQATIAIEDKDFYKHSGIAIFSGILRAIRDSILHRDLQGGSTITQQLVKTALLTPDRTIERKIKEIILALWAEQLYTKDQILEMYLNQVAYGGSAYGIEEASKVYFGKDAKDLTLPEAALLAGLPQAPSLYSPQINPALALQRRNEVLTAMKNQGYISASGFENAIQTSVHTVPPKTLIKAPHFVFYTKSELENLYGIKTVEEGGLRVTTTLDLSIQQEAEKILQEELAKIQYMHVTNGAILVTRPKTGEILAMVGSKDYFSQPYGAFNVTTALRQPGSSIKPLMYSLALQKGFTAATILDDSPIVFNIPGSVSYRPVNYDGKFHGKVPLRYALANSFNIPAVKTLNVIGIQDFVNHAAKMGITTWTDDSSHYGLSLTLGGAEVKMVDMAVAYGVFANAGYKVGLTPYLKIQDVTGSDIREISPYSIRVLDDGISYIISDMLSDNFARQIEFGPNSSLNIPGYQVAVKTGTTNDDKDNWTIGYTPDFLVAVWVGNNDNSPMNKYLVSGITGAAPIWNRMMTYLLENYSDGHNWFAKPSDVTEKKCYFGRTEYFIKGTENSTNCSEGILGTTGTPTPTPAYNH